MKLNRLLSFLFKVRKSKFKLSEQEVALLRDNKNDVAPLDEIIDLEKLHQNYPAENDENKQLIQFYAVLTDIFYEAEFSKTYENVDFDRVNFNSLESFKILTKSHETYQREFALFLVTIQQDKRQNSVRNFYYKDEVIPTYFNWELLNRLLKTQIQLTASEMVPILEFWLDQMPFCLSLTTLLNQFTKTTFSPSEIKTYVPKLESILRSRAITYLELKDYMIAYGIIKRKIQHVSFPQDTPDATFELLPDNFGNHINKLSENLPEAEQKTFYKILRSFETKELTAELMNEIEADLKNWDPERWHKLYSKILRKGAMYVPRTISLTHSVSYDKGKTYRIRRHMFKENIKILMGFVQYATKLESPIDLDYILRILERSYQTSSKNGYGPTSRTLGKNCIELLANHFGDEGRDCLIGLYHSTKFKTIKKQIELESKSLLERTGKSLL